MSSDFDGPGGGLSHCWQDQYSGLELGNQLSGLFEEDRVRDDELMLDQFSEAKTGGLLILQRSLIERKSWVRLLDISQGAAGCLHLDLILGVVISTEDGGLLGFLTRLAQTGANGDV